MQYNFEYTDLYNPTPIEVLMATEVYYTPDRIEIQMEASYREKINLIPNELCISKKVGWETIIEFNKNNLYKILDFLYDKKSDYKHFRTLSEQNEHKKLYIIAFWD